METMKFPKMSELRNNNDTKDFSIFADKEESLVNQDKQPKQGSKKYNEDGSLFVYPNSADSSLDNKRKPFQELAVPSSNPADQSDIDFEPPMMASTCNFKQLRAQAKEKAKDVEFEPSSSSTCNFKNMKAKLDKEREHERLLETILDTTDADTDENSSESIEKEKLFNKFLGNASQFEHKIK